MGKTFYKTSLLLFSLVLAGSIATASRASALLEPPRDTSTSSITISPAVSRPVFNSNTTETAILKVINTGDQPYEFVVYAGPYSVKTENYDPDFVTINKSNQAYQWIQFEKTSYDIKPGQTIEVPYEIIVPKDAAPGGHYAVLFAETQPPKPRQSNVERKKRVGSLVYMTVDGATKMSGKVESWNTDFWQRSTPLHSSVRIRNDGNTHFLSNTHITYRDIFGRERLKYNQEAIIMPGTTRRVTANLGRTPVFGLFKVSGRVELLDTEENLSQKYILYTPLWFVYGLVGSIFVGTLLALSIKRRKKRAKGDESKDQPEE